MKSYIVSEEELKNWLRNDEIEVFLKSKQPVELVAEGEVIFDDEDDELWIGEGETWLHGEFKNLEGQNIKLYIAKNTKWMTLYSY